MFENGRILYSSESVEDPSYQLQVIHYREGQDRVAKVLTNAVKHGQPPESFNVRLGSIATIVFINGLIRKWIMFPDELGIETEIPAPLEGLNQMILSGLAQP